MVSDEFATESDAVQRKPAEQSMTTETVKSPVPQVAKKKERGRPVVPGEVVGTEEEFLAGKGTWTDSMGVIRASVAGELFTDENRQVFVVPTNVPPDVQVGSVVYGRIDEMFESVAFVVVEVPSTGTKERILTLSGVIPVSEIKDAFVPSIRDELRVGDIVKAVVAKLTPFRLELSVKPAGMGVVKAFCTYDRQEMELQGSMVVCTVCGQKERRLLGVPYGEAGLLGETVALVARPRREGFGGGRGGPRREGGSRGGYSGDRGGSRSGYGGGSGGSRGGYSGGRSGDRGGSRSGYGGDRGGSRGSFGGGRSSDRSGGRSGGSSSGRPSRPSFGGRGAGQARY